MKDKTKKKSVLKTTAMIFCCVIATVLLAIFGFRAFFRLSVYPYYASSQKAFYIPDIDNGFVAQGLEYDGETDSFFVAGYDKDGSASPVYVVDKKSGELKTSVRLRKQDGTDFTNHSGGIAVYGEYVYIAGCEDRCLYVFDKEEILSSTDGWATVLGSVSLQASGEDYVKPSCVTIFDGKLYVAEFYYDPGYPTQDSHKMNTPSGEYQQALLVAFDLSDSENSVYGVSPVPQAVYSVTDKVQGMAFWGDQIYLSTSYGLDFSYIYAYHFKQAGAMGETSLLGASVPLYALDSECLEKELKIPPMSEEMVIIDGKLYVMCESASNKYIFGKFLSAQWCYATDLT